MKNNACSFSQMVIVRHKPDLLSDNKKEKFSCSNSSRVYHSQKFCTCVLLISACNSVYKNFFSLFCCVDINKKNEKPGFLKHVETKLFSLSFRYTDSQKSEKQLHKISEKYKPSLS